MLSRIYLRGTVNVTQNKGLKQTHWTWRPGSNLGSIKRRVDCTWVIVDVIEPANKMCRTSADWARLQETVTTQLLSECRTPVDLKVAGGSFPGESHLFEYFCTLISDVVKLNIFQARVRGEGVGVAQTYKKRCIVSYASASGLFANLPCFSSTNLTARGDLITSCLSIGVYEKRHRRPVVTPTLALDIIAPMNPQ